MSEFGVCACVSKQGVCEKQEPFNLHCHYTDGQRRVVSVQTQRLFANILDNILTVRLSSCLLVSVRGSAHALARPLCIYSSLCETEFSNRIANRQRPLQETADAIAE